VNAKKGYYSLIQFCPDASRLEAVNVGVLLFCPDVRFIAARTARTNRRAEKLVGRAEFDRASLNSAKRALERRMHTDREAFTRLEDLRKFVDSRGNVLKLTPPRPVKVFDPEVDLDNLFSELVGGVARLSATELAPSQPVAQLRSVFRTLHEQGRARLDWDVPVPLLGRPLHIPYAYRNGAWNLVKPHRFSAKEESALRAAERFAIEGDLLFKHPTDDNGQKRLIVVTSFESKKGSASLQDRVEDVLEAYNVKTVHGEQVDTFLAEVEQEAHA
jgi:hypothetical protein